MSDKNIGPGRPRVRNDEKTQPHTISLTPAEAEHIRQIGNGNLTAGIRKAIESMNTTATKSITIEKISTKPEHDPYTNISGIVSRTYVKLDPRDLTLWVTQEYNDNSTPSDEWHGLVLTWQVPNHPTESAMREWIEEHLADFQRICDGYESVWDGSNHVGRLTAEAHATKESIEFALDNGAGALSSYYEYWSVEEWTSPIRSNISATTTDDELRSMAHDAITALDGNQLLDDDEDGVYSYFAKRRDELVEELNDE